jgi:hypothetical protein
MTFIIKLDDKKCSFKFYLRLESVRRLTNLLLMQVSRLFLPTQSYIGPALTLYERLPEICCEFN